jgi:hypothetical protein
MGTRGRYVCRLHVRREWRSVSRTHGEEGSRLMEWQCWSAGAGPHWC